LNAELTPDSETSLELLALPEWLKVLRHFELGQGFAFVILLARNRSVARLCRSELDLWLRARRRPPLFTLPITTPDDLSNLPEQLLTIASPDGPVWVDGTGAREVYEQAWTRCAMKLNRARDGIAARFSTPVILVGAPWIREVLRDTAPDFWSVRAFVAEISPPQASVVLLPTPAASSQAASEFAFDPDLALRAIADTRGKPGLERQLSRLLDRAGTELMNRGRSQEALTLLREAMKLDESAVHEQPGRADYLRDLSVSYNRMGDLQRTLGEGEAARQFYEKSLQLREQLVAEEPGRADYLRDLSVSYDITGDLQSALGEGEAARQFYEKALQLRERLVAEEPGRADYLRDLSVSYNRMGDLQRALGEGEAARQFYEKSLQIAERLVAQEPGRADYLRDLSVSYERMGDLRRSLGEVKAARHFYEKGLQIAERLVAEEPGRADYLFDLVKSLARVGGVDHVQRALGSQISPRFIRSTRTNWIVTKPPTFFLAAPGLRVAFCEKLRQVISRPRLRLYNQPALVDRKANLGSRPQLKGMEQSGRNSQHNQATDLAQVGYVHCLS
jgi:tetratricopeptide (TPR) repeat protein